MPLEREKRKKNGFIVLFNSPTIFLGTNEKNDEFENGRQ